MQNPEDIIDPSLITTFNKERNWLSSYFQQLSSNTQSIPSILQSSLPTKPALSSVSKPPFPKELFLFTKEMSALKSNLQEKQAKIEELSLTILNQEVNFESWKKLKWVENENLALKLQASEEAGKNLQGQIEDFQKEKEKNSENLEFQMLTTKVNLLEEELRVCKELGLEKDLKINELQEQLMVSEQKRNATVEFYKAKEQNLRTEIESSYSYVEMQQKIDYYSKKMKEFQHKYLEIKSYEDHMLKILERNQELESKNESQEQQISQFSTAYIQLKQDYEFLSVKLKSVSDILLNTQAGLQKEIERSARIDSENYVLHRELVQLAEKQADTNLNFSTVEEIVIMNTQLNIKVEELQKLIERLQSENLELKRRIFTFEQPKKIPVIENEVIPEFECNLQVTREQFIEGLTMKNERLMAEIEYFTEKLKLVQAKEEKLSEENTKLERIIEDLTEKFVSLECIDFNELNNEQFSEQVKILEAKLQVTEKITEKLNEENKKLKESLEGLTEYCIKLEQTLAGGLVDVKNAQDEFITKLEISNLEMLELRKQKNGLEEVIQGKNKEFEVEIEKLRGINQELLMQIDESGKKIMDKDEELRQMERLNKEAEEEFRLRNENLEKGSIAQIEKLTFLVYKVLNRPNDIEDAKASQ